MNEQEKTSAIEACQTFAELESAIRDGAPFISNSRENPVIWEADVIIRRIFIVIDGGTENNVTRANGLRDKVVELISKL